ncbi:hypothetical protein, partial [Vibrio parahaemolyticus]
KCGYILSVHDVAKVKKIQEFHGVPDVNFYLSLTKVITHPFDCSHNSPHSRYFCHVPDINNLDDIDTNESFYP